MTEKSKGLSVDFLILIMKGFPALEITSYSRRRCLLRSINLVSGCRPSGIGFRSAMSSLIESSDRMTIDSYWLTFGHGYATLPLGVLRESDCMANHPKPSAKNAEGRGAKKSFT